MSTGHSASLEMRNRKAILAETLGQTWAESVAEDVKNKAKVVSGFEAQ